MNLDIFTEVLKHEGVVAIGTQGEDGPHIANTWNSYVRFSKDGHLVIPVGGMNVTESNLQRNSNLVVTLGSREVQGLRGMGTGFFIKGTGRFVTEGDEFLKCKEEFPWIRAALKIEIGFLKQTQ